jgi:hypothetical protein
MDYLSTTELNNRLEMTRASIDEAENNLMTLREDHTRLLAEVGRRATADKMEVYMVKLRRIYAHINAFTYSSMPKKTASYRFVDVPVYRDAAGKTRKDPLEYRIDEENDTHMIITFYVASDELRAYITRWWKYVFEGCAFISYYPDDE